MNLLVPMYSGFVWYGKLARKEDTEQAMSISPIRSYIFDKVAVSFCANRATLK